MAPKPYPTQRVLSDVEIEYISNTLAKFDKDVQGEDGCGVFLIYGQNPRAHVDTTVALLNLFNAQFEEVECRRHFMWWTKEKRVSGISKIISNKSEYTKNALSDLNDRVEWGGSFFYTEPYAGYLPTETAVDEEQNESYDSAWRAADAMGTRPIVFLNVISDVKDNALEFLDYAFPEHFFSKRIIGSLDCSIPAAG